MHESPSGKMTTNKERATIMSVLLKPVLEHDKSVAGRARASFAASCQRNAERTCCASFTVFAEIY